MLVKVNFGEDIRRFTIDHSYLSFFGLETQLANLYKLPPQGFKIFYTDNEGDRVVLSSNQELGAAVSYAIGQANVLRLTIELASPKIDEKIPVQQPSIVAASQPKITTASTGTNTVSQVVLKSSLATNTQPIVSNSISTNTNPVQQNTASTSIEITTTSVGMNTNTNTNTNVQEDKLGRVIDELDMDELLAHPKFQEKLSIILSHAISTQAFSQLLQSMLPQMKDILKESIRVTTSKGNEVSISNSNNNELKTSQLSSTTSNSSSFTDFSNPPIVPLVVNIEGSVELKSSPDTKLENSKSSDQTIFYKENIEFTVVSEEPKKIEKDQKSSTPLIDSFLNLFKSNNNNNNNNNSTNTKQSNNVPAKLHDPVENEDVVIPNQEELISQLEAMGFQNREQNIKTLRFHRKFNEGLDAVIEDLLSQQAKQK